MAGSLAVSKENAATYTADVEVQVSGASTRSRGARIMVKIRRVVGSPELRVGRRRDRISSSVYSGTMIKLRRKQARNDQDNTTGSRQPRPIYF